MPDINIGQRNESGLLYGKFNGPDACRMRYDFCCHLSNDGDFVPIRLMLDFEDGYPLLTIGLSVNQIFIQIRIVVDLGERFPIPNSTLCQVSIGIYQH